MTLNMNILVSGSISFDEIMDFPGKFKEYFHPERLHQINVSFVVDRLERQMGGTATNIAYNNSVALNFLTSRVKKHSEAAAKVFVLGAVGKDGQPFIDFFRKNNINAENILLDPKLYCAFGSVITDKKDNQIWGFYYGSSVKSQKISIKKYPSDNSLLVISANHPKAFIHFQKEAIKFKIPYLYDPGMAMTWIKDNDLIEGISNSRYLVGNDYEIAMITKRIKKNVDQIVSTGTSVITTLGEKGVRFVRKGERLIVKGYKVKKVLDPTGAGDAWRGGFLAGVVSGLKTVDSLKLGNVMASFAVEKYGTVNHMPNSVEIEKRIKNL